MSVCEHGIKPHDFLYLAGDWEDFLHIQPRPKTGAWDEWECEIEANKQQKKGKKNDQKEGQSEVSSDKVLNVSGRFQPTLTLVNGWTVGRSVGAVPT